MYTRQAKRSSVLAHVGSPLVWPWQPTSSVLPTPRPRRRHGCPCWGPRANQRGACHARLGGLERHGKVSQPAVHDIPHIDTLVVLGGGGGIPSPNQDVRLANPGGSIFLIIIFSLRVHHRAGEGNLLVVVALRSGTACDFWGPCLDLS